MAVMMCWRWLSGSCGGRTARTVMIVPGDLYRCLKSGGEGGGVPPEEHRSEISLVQEICIPDWFSISAR